MDDRFASQHVPLRSVPATILCWVSSKLTWKSLSFPPTWLLSVRPVRWYIQTNHWVLWVAKFSIVLLGLPPTVIFVQEFLGLKGVRQTGNKCVRWPGVKLGSRGNAGEQKASTPLQGAATPGSSQCYVRGGSWELTLRLFPTLNFTLGLKPFIVGVFITWQELQIRSGLFLIFLLIEPFADAPSFLGCCFVVLRRCCVFYKLKASSSTSKRISRFAEPTVSLRHACIMSLAPADCF